MSNERTVTIRWAIEYNETIQIFRDESTEVISKNDPRFEAILKVLLWLPPENEFGNEKAGVHIKWWEGIPLETISHLVKKT